MPTTTLSTVHTLSNMLGHRCDFKGETFFLIVVHSCTCVFLPIIGVGREGCTTVVRWVSIGGFKEHKRAENKLCICFVDNCIVRASLSNQSTMISGGMGWGCAGAPTTVVMVGVKCWFKGALESIPLYFFIFIDSCLALQMRLSNQCCGGGGMCQVLV